MGEGRSDPQRLACFQLKCAVFRECVSYCFFWVGKFVGFSLEFCQILLYIILEIS